MSGSPSVGDRATMKSRLLAEQCSTCIFRPGNRMRLAPGRLGDLVQQCLREESFVVCHQTLPETAPPGVQPAICRGFYDRFATAALQIAHRMWGFLLTAVPGMRRPEPGETPPEPGWMNRGQVPLPKRPPQA